MLVVDFYTPTGRFLANHELTDGRYRVGRSMLADVRVKHDAIGRNQAVLECVDGRWTIQDREGSPGMWKDGERISAHGPLQQGDIIVLGDCEMHVTRIESSAGTLNTAREAMARAGASVPVTKEDGGTDSPSHEGRADPVPSSSVADTVTDHGVSPAMSSSATTGSDHAAGMETETGASLALKASLHEAIVRTMDLYRRDILNELSHDELRQEARSATEQVIANGDVAIPDDVDQERLIREIVAEAVGYGPLETLLADPSVTEIMVNGAHRVYAERAGRLTPVTETFTDDESLLRVIERIVTSVGRRIDEGQPLVDARLPDGSRVNAIIPPLSLVGPCVTIRKFTQARMDLDQLVAYGSLSRGMAEFLMNCVRYRRNIVVSGGTGSGKTTFLNALSGYIPPDERIITIEDAAELKLDQEHVISLEARPENVEGKGEIPIRDLVRNSLRMRPDRIIVGECRGGEALDMLQAMNTGHEGSLTTGHANAPRDLLSRLEVMVLMAGMDLPVRAIREQIASAVDVIVQQQRLSDGTRRITSIHEVTGMEGDVVLMQKLFEFRQSGIDPNGRVLGEFRGEGQEPTFYETLRSGGIELDRSVFSEAQT